MDDVLTCFDEVLDRLASPDANIRGDAAEAVLNEAGTNLDVLLGLLHAAFQRGVELEPPEFWPDRRWLPIEQPDGRQGHALSFHTSVLTWVLPAAGDIPGWNASIGGQVLRRDDGESIVFASWVEAVRAVYSVVEQLRLSVDIPSIRDA